MAPTPSSRGAELGAPGALGVGEGSLAGVEPLLPFLSF